MYPTFHSVKGFAAQIGHKSTERKLLLSKSLIVIMSLSEKLKKQNKKTADKEKSKSKSKAKEQEKEKEKKTDGAEDELSSTIGRRRSFAMAEAHKRLRTNIMFSFADDSECHIIGVTSAMAHEGKSTTSINLAYDLMKAGKKTLLIDADMRLSRVAHFLEVNRAPGLSNMLVGKHNIQNPVQYSNVHDGMEVITCGDIPPNPTELLSSKRFEQMLDALKKVYEYIIIDLPPVAEVSDALIASKAADGMIVVVRQDFVDKRLLDDTVHQLNLSGARIIGLVLTCAQYKTKYGKYKYKKSSGKKYGYGGYYGYGKRHHGYYHGGYYGYHRSPDEPASHSAADLFDQRKFDEE